MRCSTEEKVCRPTSNYGQKNLKDNGNVEKFVNRRHKTNFKERGTDEAGDRSLVLRSIA